MLKVLAAGLATVMAASGCCGSELVLTLGGTFYQGAPQYQILADDVVVAMGSVLTEAGDVSRFDVGEPKRVAIRFVNDLAGPKGEDGKRPPGTDRNLIIEAVEFGGKRLLGKQLLGPAGVSKSGNFAVVSINQTVPLVVSAAPSGPLCEDIEVHLTGFENGRLLPSKEALATLDKIVAAKGCDAIITGYSSTSGNDDKNKEVAAQRARAVLDYLTGKGVRFASVDVEGWGETNVFGPEEADNRRVVVAVHPAKPAAAK